MTNDSGGVVRYTVKEVLARIESKVDSLTGLLASKADRGELMNLSTKLENMEKHGSPQLVEVSEELKEMRSASRTIEDRIQDLEAQSATKDALETHNITIEQNRSRTRWAVISASAAVVGVILNTIFNILTKLK